MDEVFGFVPPTEQPPAKKPILTILKQGRAFGVGMALATQNPWISTTRRCRTRGRGSSAACRRSGTKRVFSKA